MHVIYKMLRGVAKGNKYVIVAERIKRLDSIINKLSREPEMSLWRMQDLGGCRVILPGISQAYKFIEDFESKNNTNIALVNEKDYIKTPKTSGYRSIHRVYKFIGKDDEKYKNILIEVQFRSLWQHLWATAVETVSIIVNQNIKSSQGDDRILEYFALVSKLIESEEIGRKERGLQDADIRKTISMVVTINKKYKIMEKLNAMQIVMYHSNHKMQNKCSSVNK